MKPGAAVPVWDRVVRTLHWSLVTAVALAWLSTDWFGRPWPASAWHQPAGYLALAVVLLRVVWGFVGRGHARFADFVRAPRAVLAYVGQLLRGREARHVGHNPLGGWMILALMACVVGLALTGWLYTTDRFWGDETVERVHTALAWSLLVLAALHVAGVLFTGWRQRENLIAAMWSGRKRPPDTDATG